jgi:hypothetical protein
VNNFLSRFLCVAGILALAVSSGCDSTPVRVARATLVVPLSPDHASTPVDIEVVTNISVEIPAPPAGSDLIWEIVSNNTRVLDQTTPLKPKAPAVAGESPAWSVTFYSLRPGKSVLRFVLVHPNEAEATPVAKCALSVRVNDD